MTQRPMANLSRLNWEFLPGEQVFEAYRRQPSPYHLFTRQLVHTPTSPRTPVRRTHVPTSHARTHKRRTPVPARAFGGRPQPEGTRHSDVRLPAPCGNTPVLASCLPSHSPLSALSRPLVCFPRALPPVCLLYVSSATVCRVGVVAGDGFLGYISRSRLCPGDDSWKRRL